MNLLNATGGGPGQGPTAEKVAATTEQHVRGLTLPVAEGVFYPPVGRRHLGVVVVRSCPSCRELHLHRAESHADIDGAARNGSCGTPYRVELAAADLIGGVS